MAQGLKQGKNTLPSSRVFQGLKCYSQEPGQGQSCRWAFLGSVWGWSIRPTELTLFHTDTRKQTLDMDPAEPVL